MYIKKLTYEERAVWGVCPVRNAQDGEPCKRTCPHRAPCDICGSPLGGPCLLEEVGTHAARLINAPAAAAVEDTRVGD